LPRNGILSGAKLSLLPPSLALSYSQRYCTALEQWAQAKLCGVEHRTPPLLGRATIMLGIGPHSGLLSVFPSSEINNFSLYIWFTLKNPFNVTFELSELFYVSTNVNEFFTAMEMPILYIQT